ncbi:hypothetical protein ACFPDQ_01050 [Pseudofrancisella aestuarii]|uniref:DUF2756 domain-containing protein n=1 Tax=Pseudofrancisella aestuarii TaxID=2670347 RepID=A0ABV9T926_9GAMM|nr:hypothetical protein [Pseudofrancisella aestuarii]
MKKLLTIMLISVLPALGFSASDIDQQSQASSNNIQRQLQQRGNLIPPPNRDNSQVQNFGRFNSNQNQRDNTAPATNENNSQTQNSQRNDPRMQRQQMRNPGMRQGFNPNASVVTPEERLNGRSETTDQGARASISRPQPQVHKDVPMNSETQSKNSVRKIQSRNQAMATNDRAVDNNIQSRR